MARLCGPGAGGVSSHGTGAANSEGKGAPNSRGLVVMLTRPKRSGCNHYNEWSGQSGPR